METLSQRRQRVRVTPASLKFWTEALAAAGGCVMTAALHTNRSPGYVRRWRAQIYGAQRRGGPRRILNQDQVDELAAAMLAGIRQVDMAHRFGVSRRALQYMLVRYEIPLQRRSRRPTEIDFSPGEALVGSGPHGQHCTDPGAS